MVIRISECIDQYNRSRKPGEPPMTQARLADALGVTQAAVSLWVNGKRALSVVTGLKIAEVLSCGLEDLFLLTSDSQVVIDEAVL